MGFPVIPAAKLSMNRQESAYNLLMHLHQKVVRAGSWPRCAIVKSWKPMNRVRNAPRSTLKIGSGTWNVVPTDAPPARPPPPAQSGPEFSCGAPHGGSHHALHSSTA